MIHPTAIVSPRAVVHSSVEIGPFSVVEADAVIGQGCKLAARTTIKGHTILGRDVIVGEGAVLGGLPQHISPPERPGRVIVGERTVIRENVTIHRAMVGEGETRIGSDCLMMVGSHAAHDVRVGNRVIDRLQSADAMLTALPPKDRAIGGGESFGKLLERCVVSHPSRSECVAVAQRRGDPFAASDHCVAIERVGNQLDRDGAIAQSTGSLKFPLRRIGMHDYQRRRGQQFASFGQHLVEKAFEGIVPPRARQQ